MPDLRSIQTEVDAGYLYNKLAENEENKEVADIFRQMSEIESSHADAFLKKLNLSADRMRASFCAKSLNRIGKIFGYDYVLGVLMDTEKSLSNLIINLKKQTKQPITGTEVNHIKVLRNIIEQSEISGSSIARFESRHRSVGGNALRAAVLGGNDGLVSNFSLVMGVAGATAGQEGVLLAGLAYWQVPSPWL